MPNETPSQPAQKNDFAARSLTQLGSALLQYIPAHQNTLPPMHELAAVKAALLPYHSNPTIWVNPQSGREYLPNTALSSKKIDAFAAPMQTVAFYEEAKEERSSRLVLFLDGHVEAVEMTQWNVIRAKGEGCDG